MEYETLRFLSWSGFRIVGVLLLYYILSVLDIFFGSLALILTAFPAVVIYYHIPPPPKTTVQKVFGKLDNVTVGAHRAACLDAPENSLAALYKVINKGLLLMYLCCEYCLVVIVGFSLKSLGSYVVKLVRCGCI